MSPARRRLTTAPRSRPLTCAVSLPTPRPLLLRHTNIVKYKTAFYSFYLPVAMAMLMAGVKDEQAYKNAQDILVEMGIFFQVQDDYLDCYGDPAVIGKIGTDIQDNKCGWLVIQALRLATPEQRKLLEVSWKGGGGGGEGAGQGGRGGGRPNLSFYMAALVR